MDRKYHYHALRVSWFSIFINLLLTLIKLIVGLLSNSIAIIADAFHSFSDLATTSVIIFSLKWSKKPADERHPFGHGRIEDLGGFLICFILVILALSFLKESIMRLISPEELMITNTFIILIFVTAAVKFMLGIYTHYVADKIESSLLHTDVFHHYSDCYSSLAVAIGLIFVKKGVIYVDSLLGIGVSLFILIGAVKIGREFVDNLIGKEAPPSIYQRINEIARSFSGVKDVHDITIHSYGKQRVISLHIVVSEDTPLTTAHSLADSIEKFLSQEGLGKCVVHVDFEHTSLPIKSQEVEKTIHLLIKKILPIKDFHRLEIINIRGKNALFLHLILDKNVSLEDSHNISHYVSKILKRKFKFAEVNIHIEPENKFL